MTHAPPGAAISGIVVEDERAARLYLLDLLQQVGGVRVVGAVGTAAEARQLHAQYGAVDVAFVDVDLGGRSSRDGGLVLSRELLASRAAGSVVLATASGAHAVDGFELGAVDYLLKPWALDRVTRSIERVRSRVAGAAPAPPAKLVARVGKRLRLLPAEDVWAVEAADRLTYAHVSAGRFDLDASLTSIERAFFGLLTRVHRNWLIRLDLVSELERHPGGMAVRIGSGGASLRVPVSSDLAKGVRQRLLAGSVGLRQA